MSCDMTHKPSVFYFWNSSRILLLCEVKLTLSSTGHMLPDSKYFIVLKIIAGGGGGGRRGGV